MSDVSDLNPAHRTAPVTFVVSSDSWPTPAAPRLRLPLAALACALTAALLVPPDAEPGANVAVVAVMIVVALVFSVRGRSVAEGSSDEQKASNRGRRQRVIAAGTTAIALALSTVAVVRASEWLVVGCVLASLALGMSVALGARSWGSMIAAGPLLLEAMVRALPWVLPTVRSARPRRLSVASPEVVLRGLVFGAVCAMAVGMLLASADPTFAAVFSTMGDWFSLDAGRSDLFVARLVVFGAVLMYVLGLGFAASTRLRQEPGRPLNRHPSEWLSPLVLVAGMIAAFLTVDATRLFGAGQAALRETSTTHAERAREGFGQLLVVTLIVLMLLAWAGRAASGEHRRWLALTGGVLLILTLLLAFSALRRLWLYQGEYGWIVTRLNGGAFELWVVVLLVTVGVAWLARRADLLPRLTAGSAGLGLLVLAMAAPDALVASANVHRYEKTQQIDTFYLRGLSSDAVPALMRLPEPVRTDALPPAPAATPWYAWNLSRSRARQALSADGAGLNGSGELSIWARGVRVEGGRRQPADPKHQEEP